MSLCKPLTVSPARIEANRINRKSAVSDRQSKIGYRKSPIGNFAFPFVGRLEEKDFLFDVRSRNVHENKQNAEK